MAGGASMNDILKAIKASGGDVLEHSSDSDESRSQLEKRVMELASRNVQLNKSVKALAVVSQPFDNSELPLPAAKAEVRAQGLIEQTAKIAASALELSQRTAELAQSNSALLRRTKTLEDTNAGLKLLIRQREDFTAALTHDLKNPLIGCNSILHALLKGNYAEQEQKHLLNEVIESNNAMLRMIWNMLDTYKYECGSLKPHTLPINLIELLHTSLKEFAYHMSAKRQTCKLDVPIALPKVAGDRIFLRRVFINLMGNAVKFTPDEGNIDVKASFDERFVHLTFEDSGAGIPFQQREHLFEQFWQGDRSEISSIGTGLGLYLSKAIVEAHQGRLECTSAEGAGAAFTVTLPRI
jgi:signal transduction histidine kinase